MVPFATPIHSLLTFHRSHRGQSQAMPIRRYNQKFGSPFETDRCSRSYGKDGCHDTPIAPIGQSNPCHRRFALERRERELPRELARVRTSKHAPIESVTK